MNILSRKIFCLFIILSLSLGHYPLSAKYVLECSEEEDEGFDSGMNWDDFDLPEGCQFVKYDPADFEDDYFEDDSETPLEQSDLDFENEDDSFDYALKEPSENNTALKTLEGGPCSIVSNCVSATTGAFIDSQIDLIVPGPHPLKVHRIYCSSERKWHFQHRPTLHVAPSGGKHHIDVGYRDDSGSGMSYRSSEDSHFIFFYLPSSLFDKGMTNCGAGEISGQTNWKNSKLVLINDNNEKKYLLRFGSHTDRFFTHINRLGRTHRHNSRCGEFQLKLEKFPNGNQVNYFYDKRNNNFVKLQALNKFDKPIGSIDYKLTLAHQGTFYHRDVFWESEAGYAKYRTDDLFRKIHFSTPSNAVHTSYKYDIKGRLTKKRLPEGRFLEIDYYTDNTFKQKGKVHHLKSPVGTDKTPIVTHTFSYFSTDTKGVTFVKDAAGNLTEYEHSSSGGKLDSILHYTQSKLHSVEKFFWGATDSGQAGNLMTRVFKDSSGIIFCRNLKYDRFGNVTQDSLWGNLTGNNTISVSLDPKTNKPKKNGCECFYKMNLSSKDGWNLPLQEDDGRKQIYSTYYPGTSLLEKRFTQCDNLILKREFFEYDDNGVVIKEMMDDGIALDKEDLAGVSERHLKITIPRSEFPIGLPQVIKEYYYDIKSKSNILLKKLVNFHSPQGKILQQEVSGSDNVLAYTLFWEYDRLGNVTKEVNALGEVNLYTYDDNGNKISEQNTALNLQKNFLFDYSNRLIKEEEIWEDGTHLITSHRYNLLSQRIATVDIYGQETLYTYDALGNVIKTQFPQMYNDRNELIFPEENMEYDALGNMIAKCDVKGQLIKKLYTIRGQPYKIEYPDGSVERKAYTLDGLLEREIAKNGLQTGYTYDAFGRNIQTDTFDPNGTLLKSTSSSYNSLQLLSETDEAGQITSYEYDGAGHRIKMIKGDHVTGYHYDSLRRLVKTVESIDELSSRATIQILDLLNRVIEKRIEDQTGQVLLKEQYCYDANGKQTQVTAFTQAGTSSTITEYNPQGEPTKITDAIGKVTHCDYDYQFSYRGQTVLRKSRTDPLGKQEINIFDTHQRVVCQMHLNLFGETIQCETYIYDPSGKKIESNSTVYSSEHIPRTVITQWEYDCMGNMVHCSEAKGTKEQKDTHYYYNIYGQKEKTLKPNGIYLLNEYDVLGRLSTYKSSDETLFYCYAYDVKDHLINVQDHIQCSTTKRAYDSFGRLVKETLGNGQILSYSYDQLDRFLSLTLPDHSTVHYQHNAQYLTSVERHNDNVLLYTHTYDGYDLAGNVASERLIGQAGPITYEYDLLQRTINTKSPHWQENIPAQGFDAAGNLTQRQVTDSLGRLAYTYEYDDLYQLTSENGFKHHHYQNDSLFNRTSKDQQPYALNDLNQLLNQTNCQYCYDSNGNLITKIQDSETIQYRYDALERLIEVKNDNQITSYTYDSFHRRLTKTIGDATNQFIYLGQNEIGSIVDGNITQLRILGISRGAEIGAAIALELHGNIFCSNS
ncbi:MAG: RHS repeat protein [Parachlamydiaceae bacterium]|nr:RHS repeat protein [Parachlamydiaceae bacterium]